MSSGLISTLRDRGSSYPTLAAAESCTGGLLMARIVGTPLSGEWFKGGVVAYQPAVKFELLGVDPGPVITSRAAEQMATGVCRLLSAEVGVSTTGVAGPESEEGVAVGTVFVGFAGPEGVECFELRLQGDPSEIMTQAVDFAIARIGSMIPSAPPIDEGPAERALLEC